MSQQEMITTSHFGNVLEIISLMKTVCKKLKLTFLRLESNNKIPSNLQK